MTAQEGILGDAVLEARETKAVSLWLKTMEKTQTRFAQTGAFFPSTPKPDDLSFSKLLRNASPRIPYCACRLAELYKSKNGRGAHNKWRAVWGLVTDEKQPAAHGK